MSGEATTAVVLARGLGTRMRRDDPSVALDPTQAGLAAQGLKGMIPDTAGRPFLSHILSGLADAGVRRVVLVVAPEHAVIRTHYDAHPPTRLSLAYAVQAEPRGTADAVLAAEAAVEGADFLVCNADNLYPEVALRSLVTLGEPGLVSFDADALSREGNIAPERIPAFALLEVSTDGYLTRLVEKPDAATARAMPHAGVSMNLWRFDAGIFAACREVPRSIRGEFELPEAAMHAVARGTRLRVVRAHAGVLDLSNRGDIATVAARLGTRSIAP